MGLAHFSIGTATDRIDLLRNVRVVGWEPSDTPIEDTWASSALAEGRQLVSHRILNAVESMGLHIIAPNQDAVVRWSQDLRRMLIKARKYWDTKYQPDIVYVMARASCETNMRYCCVHSGSLGKDSDPYGQLFVGRGAPRFWERPFVFERGAWLANPPGTGTAVLIEGAQDWCFPSYLEFDAIDDDVNCASDAKLDNLPGFAVFGKGYITVEAWIRPVGWGEGGLGRIADKSMWFFTVDNNDGLRGYVYCVTRGADSKCGLDEFTIDGNWHHVLMTYDEQGLVLPAARTVYLAIDGVWTTTYTLQQTSLGNYGNDAAIILRIGDNNASGRCFDGDIGWVRVSDNIRQVPPGAGPATFTPPLRCTLPDIDASTQGQWIKEGDGAAVANQSGGTAGTITLYGAGGAEWGCDCPESYGYTPPPGGTGATGWWDPLDEGLCVWGAWQAKDVANFAASLVDLTGNGNHLVDPGGANTPGWDAVNGWIFDGINDYLTSSFIPANDQMQAMLCRFHNFVDIAGNNYLAGCYTAGQSYFTIAPDNGNIVFTGNGRNLWTFGASFNSGNLGLSQNVPYKNGVPFGGLILGYTVVPTFPLYVGCFNNAGGAAGFAQVMMQAFVVYDCSLTALQMAAIHSAMMAL